MIIERRSIELALGDPRDCLPESDPLGWQVPNLGLEGKVWNDPPTGTELAYQLMNVRREAGVDRC